MKKNYIKCECGTIRNTTLSPACPICKYNAMRDGYAKMHINEKRFSSVNKGRTVYKNTCEWCGKEFITTKKIQKYCNRKCSAKCREYDLSIKKQQL